MKTRIASLAAVALFSVGTIANAAPVTYIAADNGVSSLAQMVNSQAAAASFLSVTGAIGGYDFEGAQPANLSIVGGSTTNNSGCGALCGFNTTSGGQNFRLLVGGQVTFSFTNPVDAFGFYVNGLQTNLVGQQTITYVDGSSVTQVINFPSAINGGGAFVGFVDFGQQIASVTFDATNDILGFDDLRFGNSATNPSVPEPGTMVLMASGLAGIVASIRRRRSA